MLLFLQHENLIARVGIRILVSHLPEHDPLDVGRTFLYVHLQNFTLGLRLETPPRLLQEVCTSCVSDPTLIAWTIPHQIENRRPFSFLMVIWLDLPMDLSRADT